MNNTIIENTEETRKMNKRVLFTIAILLISHLNVYADGFNCSNVKIPNGEQLTLQSRNSVKGTSSRWINTVTDTTGNNLSFYLIENGDNTIIKIRKMDLMPILFHQRDEKGNTKKELSITKTKLIS